MDIKINEDFSWSLISLAEALCFMNDPDLEKTIEFCRMFDKLFDCLNVSSLEMGAR